MASSRSRSSSRVFGPPPILGGKSSRAGGVGNGGGGGGGGGGVGIGSVSAYLSSGSAMAFQLARPAQISNSTLLEQQGGSSRRIVKGARLGQDFEVGKEE